MENLKLKLSISELRIYILLFASGIFLQSCAVLHSEIKKSSPVDKMTISGKEYGYELFNWINRDNGELSRILIKGIQENTTAQLEYGSGGKNYVQIILDRRPGEYLIASNVSSNPGEAIIRILNRVLTVVTFTIIPFRVSNERLITVNVFQDGNLVEQRIYQSDYQVFIGLGFLIFLPWSDKGYIKNDMLRIGKEIGKEF